MSFISRLLRSTQQYSQVGPEEEDRGDEHNEISTAAEMWKYKSRARLSMLVNAVLAIIIAYLFFSRSSGRPGGEELNAGLRNAPDSSYSPIFDRVVVPTNMHQLQGTFLDEGDEPDIYRSLPNNKSDEAWDRLAEGEWFMIGAEEVSNLGKNVSEVVRAPEEWGYGNDAYIATLDLNHQVHCLNLLRKAAFPDHYAPRESPRFRAEHIMHCTSMLLQNIMCTGTVDVITFNWKETQRNPVPDFNVRKGCRNIQPVLNWQAENRLLDKYEKRFKMEKQEDEIALPMSPKLSEFLQSVVDEEAEFAMGKVGIGN